MIPVYSGSEQYGQLQPLCNSQRAGGERVQTPNFIEALQSIVNYKHLPRLTVLNLIVTTSSYSSMAAFSICRRSTTAPNSSSVIL